MIMDRPEYRLAEFFGRKRCILVGNGTTALFILFQALGLTEASEILYPAATCETAVNGAVFAGMKPVFTDVLERDSNLDPEKTIGACHTDEAIKAVVATHLYGHLMDVQKLVEALGSRLLIIEDAAQGYGGSLDNTPAGSMGHASIVSFGPGKLLDCGGGGAILTNDPGLAAECEALSEKLPGNPEDAAKERGLFMRELFMLRKSCRASSAGFVQERIRLLREHRHGYVFALSEETRQNILERFERMAEVARCRREAGFRLLEELGQVEGVECFHTAGQPAWWRFSFMTPAEIRDPVRNGLEKAGFKATTLFEPMSRHYRVPDEVVPAACRIFDRIVNLSFDFDESGPRRAAEAVKEIIYER